MKSSKIVKILLAFSPAERKALRKFVHSPAHNPSQDVIMLCDFILDNLIRNFISLTKENAFTVVFNSEDYNDQKIRYCMSDLMKVLEKFLIWKETIGHEVEAQIYLTRAYRKLGIEQPTRQALNRATKVLEKSANRDAEFYEKGFQLEMESYLFSLGEKRTAPRNLQEINRSIDMAYLARKLRQSCLALSHGAVANVEYDSGLLDLTLDYLENAEWLDDHPAISLYFYFYQAVTKREDSYFYKLKKGISEARILLPSTELRSLYLHAINYTIRRYNQGEEQFLAEMFELYRAALRQEILIDKGQLSRFAFKNIGGIAIRLGEYDWAEEFIEKYSPNIEIKHRQNYHDFILAKLHYSRRNLDQAMLLLRNVEYEDVFLNLDAKVLLLKMYIETNERDVLDSYISSFLRFLNRKKELGYHRENYTNTLLFSRRLMSINPFDKEEKKSLKNEIEKTKAVGEREWLLSRLNN